MLQRLLGITLLLSTVVFAQSTTPRLFFTDLDSGPLTGGENNHGVYVCVFGVNLGSTPGTITVGGVPASSYAYWGPSGTNGPASDKACFQMGATTALGTQDIDLTAGGVQSNALSFTVRSTGAIYCVDSAGGSDANNGKFTTDSPAGTGCKATLTAGYALLGAGDTVYVKSGTYQSNGYSNAMLWLNGSGTAGNPKAVVGYPGSSSTIGFDQNDTYTYGIRGNGATNPCDYHTIANLQTIHAGAHANQGLPDASGQVIGINGCRHMRVIGNRVTNPFQNNQEAALGGSAQLIYPTVYEHAYNVYLGNEVFNTGTSVPARVTNNFGGPYAISSSSNTMLIAVDGGAPQTIALNTCSSCTIAAVVSDINSKLTGAKAYSLNGAIIKIESNTARGGAGSIMLSPVANSAYAALGFSAGTYYGGSNKQTHSVYFGTNSHDIEAGWNNIHDNNACRGIQMHSSPLDTAVGSADPTGATMYNMAIHDNYIDNVACDAINFASVDPSQGYVRAYNNVIWHVGTGLNQTKEGGMAGVYVAQLANKMYSTAYSGCALSNSGTAVTGNSQCHFTAELRPGWSICEGDLGTDDCVMYSATIASIADDTHLTLLPIPAPYNRNWVVNPPACTSAGNCTNLALYYRKTGVGSVEVYNNTIYDAGSNAAYTGMSTSAFCRDGGAGFLLLNATDNIVYQLGSESFVQPQGCIAAGAGLPSGYWYDPASTHNLLYSSGTPTGGLPYFALNTITSDPQFTNLAAADFSLQSTSPAIDSGYDTSSLVARDIRGVTRPQNSIVDIGAYEMNYSSTTPAAPSASLNSSASTVALGTELTLSWTTNNASSCSLDQGIGTVTCGAGSTVSTPQTTGLITYTLTATGAGGTTTASAQVNVTTTTPAPTASLTASPARIRKGGSSTLSWATTNATSVNISGIGTVAASGSLAVSPTASATYTLTATGAGGTATSNATVRVTGK